MSNKISSRGASLLLLALSASLFFGSGCNVNSAPPPLPSSPEITVAGDPPAPVVEEVPRSPGEGFVWIVGAWTWNNRWVWERGHWDRPPHPGAVWVPHRYAVHDGKHVFIRGGWR